MDVWCRVPCGEHVLVVLDWKGDWTRVSQTSGVKNVPGDGKRSGGEICVWELDEEVASYMVEGFGGVVTKLTKDQAKYINVKVEGPFKPESYKY